MPPVDLQRLLAAAGAKNPMQRTWKAILAVGVVSPAGLAAFCVLALVTALCETFGLALVYPLLTYIEAGGDVQKLVSTSKHWLILVDVHNDLGGTLCAWCVVQTDMPFKPINSHLSAEI